MADLPEHHFIVIGIEKDDGTVEFYVDSDALSYLPDGYVYEDEEWGIPETEEAIARDDRLTGELNKRLSGSK